MAVRRARGEDSRSPGCTESVNAAIGAVTAGRWIPTPNGSSRRTCHVLARDPTSPLPPLPEPARTHDVRPFLTLFLLGQIALCARPAAAQSSADREQVMATIENFLRGLRTVEDPQRE